MEWDKIVPLVTAAYNFFPCQSLRESPFVLMFGRDPITPFLSLLEPSPRYWGERGGHLHLDALQWLYAVTAENLKRAREKENTETETNLQNDIKIGDLVLVRNVNSGIFEPKYSPNYRIIAIHGNNHIAVKAISKQSKIGENYQVLCEESKTSNTEMYRNNREQSKTSSEESEIGENYQVSHEELKTSSMDRLSSVDCSIEEVFNKVNISLISASYNTKEQPPRHKHIELKSAEELVWDRLKCFLSSKPAVKANENSGFSFFL